MRRRIVQIAAMSGNGDWYPRLYALAEDGTAWFLYPDQLGDWQSVPPLPDATPVIPSRAELEAEEEE